MGEWHRVTGVCEASGEGQPSVCEYMEELVRDQEMFGGVRGNGSGEMCGFTL